MSSASIQPNIELCQSLLSFWRPVTAFTNSGRIALEKNEVEMHQADDVTIFHDETKIHRHGRVTITTHRIIYDVHINRSPTSSQTIALKLSDVEKAEFTSYFFTADRVHVILQLLPPATVAKPGYIRFHFNKSGGKDFAECINRSIQQKLWMSREEKVGANVDNKRKEFSTHSAGISGIIRKNKETRRNNEQAVQDSFTDLDALMKNAKTLVSLSERYSAKLAKERADSKERNTKDEDEFASMLATVGIANPVTRDSTGGSAHKYHVELARQLADVLVPLLDKTGGMLTATDVYCVFNRARGTELISPGDLLRACRLFEYLQLPIRLTTFDSGVIALVATSFSATNMQGRILGLLEDGKEGLSCLTISQVADKMDIPMVIAKEHILFIEKEKHIVRDESRAGTYFYKTPDYWLTA